MEGIEYTGGLLGDDTYSQCKYFSVDSEQFFSKRYLLGVDHASSTIVIRRIKTGGKKIFHVNSCIALQQESWNLKNKKGSILNLVFSKGFLQNEKRKDFQFPFQKVPKIYQKKMRFESDTARETFCSIVYSVILHGSHIPRGVGLRTDTKQGGIPDDLRFFHGEIVYCVRPFTSRLDFESILSPQVPIFTSAVDDRHNLISRGFMVVTNFRFIYRDYHHFIKSNDNNNMELGTGGNLIENDIDIPITSIRKLCIFDHNTVGILCKDYFWSVFSIDSTKPWFDKFAYDFNNMIIEPDVTHTFAFSFRLHNIFEEDEKISSTNNMNKKIQIKNNQVKDIGWNLYNDLDEFDRLGLLRSKFFKVINNQSYELFSTYPRYFVIPSVISNEELYDVASFRSRQRIPAIVYKHPYTHACLARAAQPITGMKRTRCVADENLINAIRQSTEFGKDHNLHIIPNRTVLSDTSDKLIYIVDARPAAAAIGNSLQGKGFEHFRTYNNAKVEFMSIENIHSVRKSMMKLVTVINLSKYLEPDVTNLVKDTGDVSESQLENTMYFHHIRMLLQGAVRIGEMLSLGSSVLVHCSDGWDRTSQLTSLAEIMLDPYYRTMKGFCILIEKEWLTFGHQFATRFGMPSVTKNNHNNNNNKQHKEDDEQQSPIFFQYLECIFQLLHLFPIYFEFNTEFLFDIMKYIYSGRFGTFMLNSSKERDEIHLKKHTHSVWTVLLHPSRINKYRNCLYEDPPSNQTLPPAPLSQKPLSVNERKESYDYYLQTYPLPLFKNLGLLENMALHSCFYIQWSWSIKTELSVSMNNNHEQLQNTDKLNFMSQEMKQLHLRPDYTNNYKAKHIIKNNNNNIHNDKDNNSNNKLSLFTYKPNNIDNTADNDIPKYIKLGLNSRFAGILVNKQRIDPVYSFPTEGEVDGVVTIKVIRGIDIISSEASQDPYCELKLGNESYKTKVHEDGGSSPVWNEVFQFHIKCSHIEHKRIRISVWDSDVGMDDSLGMYEHNITKLLMKNGRKSLFSIFDPKNIHKCTGKLELLVEWDQKSPPPSRYNRELVLEHRRSLFAEKEARKKHHEQQIKHGKKPHAVKGSLTILVKGATELKELDASGKQDPYLTMKLGRQRFETSVDDNSGTKPVWDETFTFDISCTYPERKNIHIDVWDSDMGIDDVIGKAEISVLDFINASTKDNYDITIYDPLTLKTPHGIVHLSVSWSPIIDHEIEKNNKIEDVETDITTNTSTINDSNHLDCILSHDTSDASILTANELDLTSPESIEELKEYNRRIYRKNEILKMMHTVSEMDYKRLHNELQNEEMLVPTAVEPYSERPALRIRRMSNKDRHLVHDYRFVHKNLPHTEDIDPECIPQSVAKLLKQKESLQEEQKLLLGKCAIAEADYQALVSSHSHATQRKQEPRIEQLYKHPDYEE